MREAVEAGSGTEQQLFGSSCRARCVADGVPGVAVGGPPGLAAAPPPTLTAILSEQYWRKDSPRKTSELLACSCGLVPVETLASRAQSLEVARRQGGLRRVLTLAALLALGVLAARRVDVGFAAQARRASSTVRRI